MANWILISTNDDVSSGERYLVDTTSSVLTLTFPLAPTIGDEIFIADAADWSVNNLTLVSTDFDFSNNAPTIILKNKLAQYQFIFNGTNWLVYNVALSTSKISELPAASALTVTDDDLLLYIDKDSGAYESKTITYANLKTKITEDSYLTPVQIVNDLNSYTGSPLLNPKLLNGQNSAYYLNYTNLTNKPDLATLVRQLINNTGFITNLSSFTTDDLEEGITNKYLIQESFDNYFNIAFANAYRTYSGDFTETTITDSLDNIPARPFTDQADTATDVLIIPPTYMEYFKVGQNVRVYGGNEDLDNLTDIPSVNNVIKNGFSGLSSGISITYKIAQFDLFTGKVSPCTAETTPVTNINFELFNQSNNVQISYNRVSTNYGILLYRRIDNGDYNLIDILGQKELGSALSNIIYRDYGTFNYTSWSKRNVNTGAYGISTGTIHFPLTALGSTQKGWIDASIIEVDTASSRIILNSAFYFNTDLIVSHNDTQRIQEAVNQRINAGINSLTLNDKQYIISQLTIPTQFSLYGKGRDTILKKLPWATETNNSMISMSSTIARNVNLSNFNIDGNMQNQWLKQDEFDPALNYAINMKAESETVTIDRVHISNIIAGGIFVQKPTRLLLNLSRVENSGMNDFYEYSPLIADDGSDVIVTNNTFRNFSSAIDLSVTLDGVCSSNVVENVGSGVLVFGSRFFISSQNLIKGPAGEYISGPDILNSVYDSINIILEPSTQYKSDAYTYQENGNIFDLTANRAVLSFSLDKLKKIDNAEQLYGQILISGTNPLQREFDVESDATQGKFKFSISQANVDTILSTYSYSTLKAIDANHVGLVYRALLTEYVDSGTILSGPTIDGTDYNISLTNYSNLYIGARVRMRNHGGTPDLNTIVGTIIDIISVPQDPISIAPPQVNVTIRYNQTLINAGGGIDPNQFITVENTFVLAKGRIL